MSSSLKTHAKNSIKKLLHRCGYDGKKFYNGYKDTGRNYEDAKDVLPHFTLKKAPPTPWSGNDTLFIVNNGKSIHQEIIYYSHLTLLKLCKHYDFDHVLDIGSHEGRCTRILQHLGKKVTSVEIAPGYQADFKQDYLDCQFEQPFDAIWCSQIYEHQRNPGIFLNKLFDDLKEGGILAITVPFQIDYSVLFGHINNTSPLMLIYHLVCAGFDCSQIALRCYNGSIGVILRKEYNGIRRTLPFGSIPLLPTTPEKTKRLLGEEMFEKMVQSFPECLRQDVHTNCLQTHVVSINWEDPI